jgi:hypothetical protein
MRKFARFKGRTAEFVTVHLVTEKKPTSEFHLGDKLSEDQSEDSTEDALRRLSGTSLSCGFPSCWSTLGSFDRHYWTNAPSYT